MIDEGHTSFTAALALPQLVTELCGKCVIKTANLVNNSVAEVSDRTDQPGEQQCCRGEWQNRPTWWTAVLQRSQNRILLSVSMSPEPQTEHAASSSTTAVRPSSPVVNSHWNTDSFSKRSIASSNMSSEMVSRPSLIRLSFINSNHAKSC